MNPARGSGGGHQTSMHLPILFGKHDRYCVYCGGLIPRQVQQKTVTCPHDGCRKPLPLRQGTWMQRNTTGMGRCPLCDSFVHKSFLYCQMCRNANEEGLMRRNDANTRALAEERETNKRLKLELDHLKAEKERARLMDVDVIPPAVLIDCNAANNHPEGDVENADPFAGIDDADLLGEDEDL